MDEKHLLYLGLEVPALFLEADLSKKPPFLDWLTANNSVRVSFPVDHIKRQVTPSLKAVSCVVTYFWHSWANYDKIDYILRRPLQAVQEVN